MSSTKDVQYPHKRNKRGAAVGTRPSWRPSSKLYSIVALVVAATVLGATFVVGKGSNANAAGPLKLGAVAPHVTGRDVLTGQTIDSKQLAGKNVLYYLNKA